MRYYSEINWDLVKWKVSKLQGKIQRAFSKGNMDLVHRLQKTLIESFDGRLLAVYNILGAKPADITDSQILKILMDLKVRRYIAQPVRRVVIRKGSGQYRNLGVRSLFDKCFQSLCCLALRRIADLLCDANSIGYRAGFSTMDANYFIRKAFTSSVNPRYALKLDIKGFFDNVSHDWLLANIRLESRILNQFLKCGYSYKGKVYPTLKGFRQGGVVSRILANMTLNGLEKLILDKFGRFVQIIRYADDIIIISNTSIRLLEIVRFCKKFLASRGLMVNSSKTKLYNIYKGFDFLGFNFRKYKNGAKIIFLVHPTRKSCVKIRSKIKFIFRNSGTYQKLVLNINPVLRGWANYYCFSNSANHFRKIENYVFLKYLKWIRKFYNKDFSRFVCKLG